MAYNKITIRLECSDSVNKSSLFGEFVDFTYALAEHPNFHSLHITDSTCSDSGVRSFGMNFTENGDYTMESTIQSIKEVIASSFRYHTVKLAELEKNRIKI